MKKIIILITVMVFGYAVSAQTNGTKTAKAKKALSTAVIQTNGVCDKCEALFNENVPFYKGVKDYKYDAKTSQITVTFDESKTNVDAIRLQISKLGYNADNVKADAAARAKLPACCRVEKKAAAGCSHGHAGCKHHQQGGGCGHKH